MRKTFISILILASCNSANAQLNQSLRDPLAPIKQKTVLAVTTTATTSPRINLSWTDYTKYTDWPLWQCTMRYETNSNWHFVSRSGKFRGAFAIYAGTWKYTGWPAQLFPKAEIAPPWVQIIGARILRTKFGSSQWGGLRKCGG